MTFILNRRRVALTLLSISLFTAALGRVTPASAEKSGGKVRLLLVSYAVTKAAYDEIIPRFERRWKQQTGQTLEIKASYGGSGSQTRAVIDGLEADVTNLALSADTEKLVQAGLIKNGWASELPNNSNVTRSVVAIVTRPRNPKFIKTWKDLARPSINVVTANPKTSGVARWNFLALWGSVSETGGSDKEARRFISNVYKNVDILPKDAREATDIFIKKGQGDVLLNYENEILLARQNGETEFPFVIPKVNIAIDTPVAVVDKNVDKHGTRKVAEAFAKYLFEPEAQEVFARKGFRPTHPQVWRRVQNRFARIDKLFTIGEFGGWPAAQKKFFKDGGVFDQIFSQTR